MLSYKEAGVDVDKNDELVIDIRKISDISTGFAAAFPLPSPTFIAKTGTIVQPHLVQCSDGVGTKVQIAHHYGIMEGIGQDLVAMCVNDLYCLGAKPMFFQDYIGMNNLDKRTIGIVIQSIQNACEMCDTKLTGGEMAELPGTYIHDAPELVGFATGFVFPEQMITGKTIKPGDVVMGFESSGVHSNGFSLVRKILDNMYNISDDFIRMLMKPTTIYTKVIEEHYNTDNKDLFKGIAHITGGGLVSNINRILPTGCSFRRFDTQHVISEVFQILQRESDISPVDMDKTFNMGIGMAVVVDKNMAYYTKSILNEYYETHIIGDIV